MKLKGKRDAGLGRESQKQQRRKNRRTLERRPRRGPSSTKGRKRHFSWENLGLDRKLKLAGG